MAGTQSRYAWQFKQRLTSGGLNLQTSYLARNTSEVERYLAGGTDQELALQTGIIRGFVPAVVPATLKISIGPGLGQFFSSAIGEPDSKAQWLELRAAKEVTTTPGDAANPRWDVVEVQPAAIDAAAEIIDFFNPADNTFSPAVVVVQKTAEAAAQVRQGTPHANPKLPAGTAGWIPVCYVYVAATALALDVNRVMFCRPILTPRRGTTPDNVTGLLSQFNENIGISGGGWVIDADGLVGSLSVTMNGTFPNWGRPFHLPAGTAISLSATGNYIGGGLPLANTAVYAYVAPPPYPSGYDVTLAPREMFIADTTTPNVAATIPAGARGCIVVIASGSPTIGPLGQRGSPTATHDFVDLFWGNFSLVRAQMLYIGAAFYDIALPGLLAQRVDGATVATLRKPGKAFFADLPIVAPGNLYSLRTQASGDPDVTWPETAVDIDVQFRATVNAAGSVVLFLNDVLGDDANSKGMLTNVFGNNTGAQQFVGCVVPIVLNNLGQAQVVAANHTGAASCFLYGKCYRDAVLKLR